MRAARTLALLVGLGALAVTPMAVASFDAGARPATAHQHMTHQQMASHDHGDHATQDGRVTRHDRRQVRVIRRATAKFHNIALAESAGYVPFKDVKGISCIAMPGMGGMGVHYVNPTLIGNPAIRPKAPEALVYAPDRDGTLRLAALEFLVDKAAWDAGHDGQRPQIFPGRGFDSTGAGNRFGLDPFYSQHVWAWKKNRAGLLSMWNPAVHCAFAGGRTTQRISWPAPQALRGALAV